MHIHFVITHGKPIHSPTMVVGLLWHDWHDIRIVYDEYYKSLKLKIRLDRMNRRSNLKELWRRMKTNYTKKIEAGGDCN